MMIAVGQEVKIANFLKSKSYIPSYLVLMFPKFWDPVSGSAALPREQRRLTKDLKLDPTVRKNVCTILHLQKLSSKRFMQIIQPY